jgi:hypothetical protein
MDSVDINLDGETLQLMPSFNAARYFSKKYGGLFPLVDLINYGNLEAAIDVVWLGLGEDDETKRKEVSHKIYEAGLSKLAPKLVRYVILLANGGREPEPKKDGPRVMESLPRE